MIRIGLIGCGNIGRIIAEHATNVKIVALFDKYYDRAQDLEKNTGANAFSKFDSFISGDFDLVVEAASVNAVSMYGAEVLLHGKDLVIMSVGALADPQFRENLRESARARARRIYIPSGAIFGLDNLKIGRISTIKKLLLRTVKSPASLGVDVRERRLIFSGKAHECIKAFPKNVNVSVAMSLAAGRDTDVELWVDPAVESNIHEMFIEGDFGETCIRVKNVPSPDNPATSYLAALSILSLLNNLDDPIIVGT
ncbi:MAG: putative L-aspartate dehydrogenase [Methanoregula sp. PtaU1.Bin051]|nr:MAG: putative L-aspartate dehydrogenase [Methanoregula sp. PtaU1.Bin051]